METTIRALILSTLSLSLLAHNETSQADSTTFTIHKLAGIETGLVKLAHIEDTIDRSSVIIEYDRGAIPVASDGLLYNCEGVFNRKNCDVYGTVIFEDPGIYGYWVSYTQAGIGGDVVSLSGTFIVEEPSDFVIVSVGDSVASGEGNPQKAINVLGNEAAAWNDLGSTYELTDSSGDPISLEPCHRSSFAGPVLAAKQVAENNSVSFYHLACSGAYLDNVQEGDVSDPKFPLLSHNKLNTQLHWAHLNLEQIDVLIVSGGANNVEAAAGERGFSDIVLRCLKSDDCSNDWEFRNRVATSIESLGGGDGRYAKFAELIFEGTRDLSPTLEQIPSVVAITEYFDPTRNQDGDFPSGAEAVACAGTISEDEWRYLYNYMVVPLNEQIHATGPYLGWTVVDGIEEAFRTHGYCASGGPGDVIGDSWVLKAPESIITQGDQIGTAHPDRTGQQVYGNRIYSHLVQANPPRTWAMAWVDGDPYTFGTWVSSDVNVAVESYNPIQESGVSATFYGLGSPACSSASRGACELYDMPFVVSDSGRTLLSFYSTNSLGAPETRLYPVEILIDKEPPAMTCSATPSELWTPNKKFVAVTATVTAVDEVSGPAEFWLSQIKDSYGQSETAIVGFDLGTADIEGEMFADRRGNSGPRYYTLTYSSEDHLGNSGTCNVEVIVPHDQRDKNPNSGS